jgi:photosystem II stability/assembly factor-like uncharacterized protein
MSARALLPFLLLPLAASSAIAQQPVQATSSLPDSGLFREFHWRSIGPFRASRTRAAAGHRARPFTFYAGVVNGGVWKTTDAGRTWVPIFDDQPTQSIGAVVVAPTNPDILYVGSGEGLQRPDLSVGDGVYRSDDGGRTWTNLGLRDAQQIAAIAVDPTNAERVFVATLGHPYGPNPERGIYRTLDGGRSWTPVLQRDENTGGNDVDIDPTNPQIVYANLWESRQGPWENAMWAGTGGIFKSTDGGATWKQLTVGLPEGVNQANIAISPSDPRRLYAMVATQSVGIYRSDDAGETWTRVTTDTRPAGRIGGGDLPVPLVHPRNPDVLLSLSTVSWISEDAGRSWRAYKGAPGGEDYQGGWINPDNPDIVLLAADQGAVVSLNGGDTWSSWYNQPTAQLYHVSADNAFPYRLCSGQQESGSACVASRGNYGAVSIRDWLPVGVDEYGYVAPDPLDPDIVYGGRSVSRFDRRTGQVSTVGPVAARTVPPGTYRQVRTQPVVFSEADPHALYFGNNVLWKTTSGGSEWQQLSPDLTRKTWNIPRSVGKYADSSQVAQRGVIYTIGPSYLDANRIWFGTDDGLIFTTSDGGANWTDVTPPQLGPWWKVFMVEPGRFSATTAYAAVNTLRLDDMNPHIYLTHDGGRSWTEIVKGLEGAGPSNAVREDPVKRGLLYASTEKGVYVSFDDGGYWQSLRRNLPASSARDIIVKNEDLAVALHGRGFWILDDITPLRQLDNATLQQNAVLFAPGPAWRVRWNTSTDMPWPKEEPVGENPPEGAIISYFLKRDASGPVTLEVVAADGSILRRYSSADSVIPVPEAASAPVPLYWYRQPQSLVTSAGLHRFVWDVHYQPFSSAAGGRGLAIASVPGRATTSPAAPWVNPGSYTVRLTVGGTSYTQPIVVKQDPRVRTPADEMRKVYDLTDAAYRGAVGAQAAIDEATRLREQLARSRVQAAGGMIAAIDSFAARVLALAGAAPAVPAGGGPGRGQQPAAAPPGTLSSAFATLAGAMNLLQAADVAPTVNQSRALSAAIAAGEGALADWRGFRARELAAFNERLKAARLPVLAPQ